MEEGERSLYLDTAFAYHSPSHSKTVYSDVKLCLHDSAQENQYYFFSGTGSFQSEWTSFLDYIDQNSEGRLNFDFWITSRESVDEGAGYRLKYDMELFDSYDGDPIKKYQIPLVKTCDVFVGDFFMSR